MFFKIIRSLAWAMFTFGAGVALFTHGAMSQKGMLIVALSAIILLTAHPLPEDY